MMTVVQSKWVLSQGCPQLPVIKTANGANLGAVSRHAWRIANFEQTGFRQGSECRTERVPWPSVTSDCITKRAPAAWQWHCDHALQLSNLTSGSVFYLEKWLPWRTPFVDFIYPSRRKNSTSTRFTVAETCHFLWEITTLRIKHALSCRS